MIIIKIPITIMMMRVRLIFEVTAFDDNDNNKYNDNVNRNMKVMVGRH